MRKAGYCFVMLLCISSLSATAADAPKAKSREVANTPVRQKMDYPWQVLTWENCAANFKELGAPQPYYSCQMSLGLPANYADVSVVDQGAKGWRGYYAQLTEKMTINVNGSVSGKVYVELLANRFHISISAYGTTMGLNEFKMVFEKFAERFKKENKIGLEYTLIDPIR